MKQLGISKQILVIAILPALIVAAILSTHYIWDQFDYISKSLDKNGKLIARQLSPAAEYAVYSGNIDLIDPLIETIIENNHVLRIQILDKYNNSILDITPPNKPDIADNSIFKTIFEDNKPLVFSEPITSKPIDVIDNDELAENLLNEKDNQIGTVIVTLTSQYATAEKIEQIEHGILITLLILLVTAMVVFRISRVITQPIKSLTRTVRSITAGDLDTPIDLISSGELGVLESCINQMKGELKNSQTNYEIQLNVFTDELQQTLEELEIRNAELDITRSKAIYANNAKSEFLANMSHEIRTPLSGIIGFTELLQGTLLTGQQKDYSTTIQKSAKSLLEIINDILDLSKIESGKTEITKSEFNIIDIIEDIINLLSPTALEKEIEVFYRIEKNVPHIIHSDPFRIHQILTNLIGNAIKFTSKGYVYLQVTLGEIKSTGTNIKFTVSDTGIGMSSDDKKKLFRAFTQADTSITRRFGGTGLGLVISRKLTLLMKGDISFDSTKGEGSTFWFSIPVTPGPQKIGKSELADKKIALVSNHFIARQTFKTLLNNALCEVNLHTINELNKLSKIEENNDIIILFLSRKEIKNTDISEKISHLSFSKPSLLIASTRSHSELRNLQQHIFDSAVFTSEKIERIKQKLISTINKNSSESELDITDDNTSSYSDLSNVNILVVDDNDVNLRLAEIILHKHNARVTTAMSGGQAIDYASLNSFDIIFMDLHMPGLDGYETTMKIREVTPGKQPVIIALTANATSQEEDKVIKSSMNGILIKPINDAILQKIVSQWVLKEPINISEFGLPDNIPHEQNDTDKTSVFSIDIAKEFTGNNEELAYELFAMLRAELNDFNEAISTAVKNNDLIELRKQVHKLHGASRCCGTTELKQTSSHIENMIDQKINFNLEEETAALFNAIKNAAEYKIKPR